MYYLLDFQTLLAAASMAGIVSMTNVSSIAIQPQSNQVTTSNSTTPVKPRALNRLHKSLNNNV